jgi:hypothetical protein
MSSYTLLGAEPSGFLKSISNVLSKTSPEKINAALEAERQRKAKPSGITNFLNFSRANPELMRRALDAEAQRKIISNVKSAVGITTKRTTLTKAQALRESRKPGQPGYSATGGYLPPTGGGPGSIGPYSTWEEQQQATGVPVVSTDAPVAPKKPFPWLVAAGVTALALKEFVL